MKLRICYLRLWITNRNLIKNVYKSWSCGHRYYLFGGFGTGGSLSTPVDNENGNPENHREINKLGTPSLSCWQVEKFGLQVSAQGAASRLDEPLTAFFASRTCPGSAIRAAIDWAVAEARSGHTIIGGFHSPLERSVLEVLLTARSKVVIALARDVAKARLPDAWRQAALKEEIAIVSVDRGMQRLTEDLASTRNDWVARIASNIVIAHAEPGGQLERDVKRWRDEERNVSVLGQQ